MNQSIVVRIHTAVPSALEQAMSKFHELTDKLKALSDAECDRMGIAPIIRQYWADAMYDNFAFGVPLPTPDEQRLFFENNKLEILTWLADQAASSGS